MLGSRPRMCAAARNGGEHIAGSQKGAFADRDVRGESVPYPLSLDDIGKLCNAFYHETSSPEGKTSVANHMLAICLVLCYTSSVCCIHEGDAGTVVHVTIIQRHSLGFASKTLYQIHLEENT